MKVKEILGLIMIVAGVTFRYVPDISPVILYSNDHVSIAQRVGVFDYINHSYEEFLYQYAGTTIKSKTPLGALYVNGEVYKTIQLPPLRTLALILLLVGTALIALTIIQETQKPKAIASYAIGLLIVAPVVGTYAQYHYWQPEIHPNVYYAGPTLLAAKIVDNKIVYVISPSKEYDTIIVNGEQTTLPKEFSKVPNTIIVEGRKFYRVPSNIIYPFIVPFTTLAYTAAALLIILLRKPLLEYSISGAIYAYIITTAYKNQYPEMNVVLIPLLLVVLAVLTKILVAPENTPAPD